MIGERTGYGTLYTRNNGTVYDGKWLNGNLLAEKPP
jgi:hypothetical protein